MKQIIIQEVTGHVFRRWSLRTKITISVVTVLIIASYAVLKLTLGGIVSTVQRLLGEKAIATVTAAEALLPTWMFASEEGTSPAPLWYQEVVSNLRALQEESNTHAVRVVRYLDGRTATVLIDTAPPQSSFGTRSGSVVSIDQHEGLFFSGSGTMPWYDDKDGYFMVAWHQVDGVDGRPAGSVLTYIDANDEVGYLQTVELTIIALALTLTALGGYISYKLGAAFEMTAITDGLTGLYNHKHFKQRLEFECHRAARYRVPLSIVLMDIDRFKSVNDTYGHAVGDLVLKNVAKWLKQSSRNTDLVARYGGEELAVILPHTGLAGAQEFAERVRLKIANEVTRDQEEDVTLRVTVSLGVAQFEPGLSPMDLIKRADTALYQSKNNGRNRVTIWQDDLIPPLETKADPDKVPVETR